MFVLLLAVLALTARGGAVCSVAECDRASEELALQFACQSDAECSVSIVAQLVGIVPVDAEEALAKQRDLVRQVARSDCPSGLPGGLRECYAPSFFLAGNDLARIPSSAVALNASTFAAEGQREALEAICGEAACSSAEECAGFVYKSNRTCEEALDWARWDVIILLMRRWYMLRRERQHLERLHSACIIQGSQACVNAVEDRLQIWASEIEDRRPFKQAGDIVSRNVLGEPLAQEYLHRPCEEGLVPCVTDLLSPLISAPDDVTAKSAVQSALTGLTAAGQAGAQLFDEFVKNASTPAVSCGFSPGHRLSFVVILECPEATKQISTMLSDKSSTWTFMTDERVQILLANHASCWLGCRLLKHAVYAGQRALQIASGVRSDVMRYARVQCASQSACLRAVSERVAVMPPYTEPIFEGENVSRAYAAANLFANSVLVVAALATIVLIAFVWKIASYSVAYIVITCSLLVAMICHSSFFVASLALARQSYVVVMYLLVRCHLFVVCLKSFSFQSTTRFLILLIVLASMSLDWISAFVIIVRGVSLSPRSEKIMRIATFASLGVLLVLLVTFPCLSYSSYVSGLKTVGFDAFNAMFALVVCFLMAAGAFLFVSTIVAYVLLKRGNADSGRLTALRNMSILYGIMFVVLVFHCINSLMVVFGWWVYPEWYRHGIDNTLAYFILMACCLTIILTASHAKHAAVHGSKSSGFDASQEEPLLDMGKDHVPPAYDL